MADEFDPGNPRLRFGESKHLNLLDSRVTEIANCYFVGYDWSRPHSRDLCIDKVIVSVSPSAYYLALLSSGELSILKLDGFSELTKVHSIIDEDGNYIDEADYSIIDIANYKGKIYGLNHTDSLYVIDYVSRKKEEYLVATVTCGLMQSIRKRLVESNGDLYLVLIEKACGGTSSAKIESCGTFKAYKLDEHLHRWTRVRSLGDKVFFLGHDFSFSFSLPLHVKNDWDCIVAWDNSLKPYKLADKYQAEEKDTGISWEVYLPPPHQSAFFE